MTQPLSAGWVVNCLIYIMKTGLRSFPISFKSTLHHLIQATVKHPQHNPSHLLPPSLPTTQTPKAPGFLNHKTFHFPRRGHPEVKPGDKDRVTPLPSAFDNQ